MGSPTIATLGIIFIFTRLEVMVSCTNTTGGMASILATTGIVLE